MTKIEIKCLEISDKEKIIEVFSVAFAEDPLIHYFFGDNYNYLDKYLWQYVCDFAHLSNSLLLGAFIANELRGVAFITPPEAVNVDTRKSAKIDENLMIAIGEEALRRIEAYTQIKEANKPKQAHFYLNTLGVMPQSQGQGIGKALIKALHKISEESSQSIGVALDTENENNLGFYQRLGYSASKITNLTNIKIWSMFRANDN